MLAELSAGSAALHCVPSTPTSDASLTILTPLSRVVMRVGGGSLGPLNPASGSTPGSASVKGVPTLRAPLDSQEGNERVLLSPEAAWEVCRPLEA